MKTRPHGVELSIQTGVARLLVAFRNFANPQVREFVSMQFTIEALEAAHKNLALWNYSSGVCPSA